MASVSKRDYAQFAGGKAKSLLLPMVAWNLITVGLVVFFAHFGDLRAPKPALGMAFLNEIFHLTAAGETHVQNRFLRDILICRLAAPLLARLPDNARAMVVAETVDWTMAGWRSDEHTAE